MDSKHLKNHSCCVCENPLNAQQAVSLLWDFNQALIGQHIDTVAMGCHLIPRCVCDSICIMLPPAAVVGALQKHRWCAVVTVTMRRASILPSFWVDELCSRIATLDSHVTWLH
jgi:hypothetical protein